MADQTPSGSPRSSSAGLLPKGRKNSGGELVTCVDGIVIIILAGVDYEDRSLARHGEATSVDTAVLGQLNRSQPNRPSLGSGQAPVANSIRNTQVFRFSTFPLVTLRFSE